MEDSVLIKIALSILGAILSILVWGLQKLITTLLDHSKTLLNIEHRLGEIEKDVAPLEKMKTDLNNYYFRLKNIEDKKEKEE